MHPMAIARLIFLFVHVVAFAVALGCILREDARLISRQPLDPSSLRAASTIVAAALAVLWLSGLGIILLDSGGTFSAIASNPKLLAKIAIVCVLTLNGVALHMLAFPSLRDPPTAIKPAATMIVMLGAVSAVSWGFATLLGISRGIAKALSFEGVIATYSLTLAIGICVAIAWVRPTIQQKLLDRSASGRAPEQNESLLTH